MRALSRRGLHANLCLSLIMVTLYCLKQRWTEDEAEIRKHPITLILSYYILEVYSMFVVIAKLNKLQEDTVFPTCFEYLKQKNLHYSCLVYLLFSWCSNKNKTQRTCTSPICLCPWMSRNWRTCWSTLARSYPHASWGTPVEAAEEWALQGQVHF